MMAEPVSDAVFDPAHNIVRARFAGNVTAASMLSAADQMETLLAQTNPGFSLFADFSQVAGMDLDCFRSLTRIMDLCRAHEVGLIVRILPPKGRDIGINLLSAVHYRGKVKTVTVDTVAEAERVLG